jgi:anti-anti-sigma factor
MSAPLPNFHRFTVEDVGPVSVVKFTVARLLKEVTVESIGEELFSLVEQYGRHNLVLDFSVVDRLYSEVLAKVMTLRRKAEAVGGRLVVCGLNPELSQVFETTQLDKVVSIYPDRQHALEAMAEASTNK